MDDAGQGYPNTTKWDLQEQSNNRFPCDDEQPEHEEEDFYFTEQGI